MIDTSKMPRVRLTVDVPGVEVTDYEFVRATVAEALTACEFSLGKRENAPPQARSHGGHLAESDAGGRAADARCLARQAVLTELREMMHDRHGDFGRASAVAVAELDALFDRHGL